MDNAVFANRRERLRRFLRDAGQAALLVTSDADRFYLSGFELHDAQLNESSGCLLITAAGRDILCTDRRFADAAARLWDEDDIVVYRGNGLSDINALLKDRVSGEVGFTPSALSVQAYEGIGDGVRMRDAGNPVADLRIIKDDDEIRKLEKACRLNEELMRNLPALARPGLTEAGLAWEIERFWRERGAEELAFPSIVAVDGNAALPHAVPGCTEITDSCCLLVDVGCRLDGYCSDQTRTLWIGDKPDALFASDAALVREAQERVVRGIRPGMTAREVYGIAAAFLDAGGVLDLFTHALGHGIGLQTHEAPSLNETSEVILRPGMVLTVEPGLYRRGRHGIRREHMMLVTEDGARVL
ncbi:MAG: Xaa-Pro peptidase family protein [Desulfovibrio sp.]|jgi:Xaa-Pro aminopeptidase|nr:Xaa-Pro peptidase family protein [Desulfovibrio sp.]